MKNNATDVGNARQEVNRNIVLLVASIGAFVTPYMSSSINIALPAIGDEFSMSAVMLSWTATSYLLASAMFLVPFGRIADIYGRRRVYLYGIMLFTIASGLCSISTSAVMLIIFRVLQGIGSSMIFGTGIAILTSVFPPGQRGKVIGINVAVTYIGLSAGPFIGGVLTQNFGWRSIFLVIVPLGFLVAAGLLWKIRLEWAGAHGEKFDYIGSVIYGLALFGLVYGFSLLPGLWGFWLVLAGAAGIVFFGLYEVRAEAPVLDIKLFRSNRVFILSSIAALISYSATYAVSFLLSLYLQYIKGFSPQDAGAILIIQPAVQAVLSPFAGKLSDRVEPRRVASAGMASTAVGLVLLTFLGDETPMGFIAAALAFLGFGFALFSSPNTNAIMSSVEMKFYGVASGVVSTMRLTGQMLSMGITMLVFAIYIGRVSITPEYYALLTASARISFVILTLLCLGGIAASLVRGNVRRDVEGT